MTRLRRGVSTLIAFVSHRIIIRPWWALVALVALIALVTLEISRDSIGPTCQVYFV